MQLFSLVIRLFKRELLQGQLLLILFALSLAVLAVTGLSRVSERLQLAINEQASEFIAADRVLSSPREVDPAWLTKADELGIAHAQTLSFSSVVFSGEQMQLVQVRAVSANYPLKGMIEFPEGKKRLLPNAGEVFYAERLGPLLNHPASLELGYSELTMAAAMLSLPDQGLSLFTSAPVVLMNLADVEATQVVQPGSRISYSYQFVGDQQALDEFEAYLKPLLLDTMRFRDVSEGDSPVASAINRAERFLLLASLLGIALACAAIAIAAGRYCQRHFDMVALLKTLGASKQQIRFIFVGHLSLIAVVATLLGLLLGAGLDGIVVQQLPEALQQASPSWLRPLLLGVATAIIAIFGFALLPLLGLLQVPPLRVLQGHLKGKGFGLTLTSILSFLALASLGYIYSQSISLTFSILIGFVLLALLLWGCALLLLMSSKGVSLKLTNPWQLALTHLRRKGSENGVQLVGFSTALLLLLLIVGLRQDILEDWQSQLPENTPNYFLVNIAPEQVEGVQQFIDERQLEATPLSPVVRGRMTQINDESLVKVEKDQQLDQGQRRGVGRELNLTYGSELPEHNTLLQGQWFTGEGEASLEVDFAERMAIELGDVLHFDIGGQQVNAKVTSIRGLKWESLKPNFFVIFSPDVLPEANATFISSFYAKGEQQQSVFELIQRYPTIALIDVGKMVEQLRGIVDQVSLSLTLVLVMVIIASSLVMLAQLQAGMGLRIKELAVFKSFGAKSSLLSKATALEFALLGAIAGFLAVVVAEVSLWVLKTQVFELVVNMHWHWWWQVPLLGALLVGALGYSACSQKLKLTTLSLLREINS
ncbi:ABC transporter permease [Paraferrimonas sp. SM1919]|uniref:ABC transporter permease n=1 Tax=Paraferrimonas sp. SM1919 TaxID=2662263 RepID=UPI001969E138|nr:FtsX-like permease family protein [Paraferrimonas sp. SM1919]